MGHRDSQNGGGAEADDVVNKWGRLFNGDCDALALKQSKMILHQTFILCKRLRLEKDSGNNTVHHPPWGGGGL